LLRRATEDDIARIFEIRNNVRENRLNHPSRVTIDDVRWFIANPGIFVWEEDGRVGDSPRPTRATAVFGRCSWIGRTNGAALPVTCSNRPVPS
jgi:hypothetical protein